MVLHSSDVVRKLYPWQKPFQFILDGLSEDIEARRLTSSSNRSSHSEVELSRKLDGTVVSKPRHRDNVSLGYSCHHFHFSISNSCPPSSAIERNKGHKKKKTLATSKIKGEFEEEEDKPYCY